MFRRKGEKASFPAVAGYVTHSLMVVRNRVLCQKNQSIKALTMGVFSL